ncbi:MAG: 5'-methylthioadenosine/S-adenosylhomocysteine nucleosidase [Calothrix sp. SM1_5_4]|nr:5'-methylthioadenosine/S-adenosylhomocysteine nucleosidase [Calothrix sp. SM1_5_4]
MRETSRETLKEAPGKHPGLHLAVGGHGKVQFALSAQKLILEYSPRLVICAGACGALTADLRVADIVAARNTIEHDFHSHFTSAPPPKFAGDAESLRRLEGRDVKFGDIASGDEDVLNRERAAAIHSRTGGAMAVAWEGAGGARACRFTRTPFLELRAVTDLCDGETPWDFPRRVQLGMKRIASVLDALF